MSVNNKRGQVHKDKDKSNKKSETIKPASKPTIVISSTTTSNNLPPSDLASDQFAAIYQMSEDFEESGDIDYNNMSPKSERKKQFSIFTEVGLSKDTVNRLSRSNLPPDGFVTVDLQDKEFEEEITEEWRRLPIQEKNGYRSYGGNYCNLMASILAKSNPIVSGLLAKTALKYSIQERRSHHFFMQKLHALMQYAHVWRKFESRKKLMIRSLSNTMDLFITIHPFSSQEE